MRLKSLTSAVPKITIPGPCALHFRGGDQAVTAHAYGDVDEFWADTVAAYHQELAALAAAGCVYVQIDETAFAKFADPSVQAMLAARGDDWRALIDRYIAVTNRVLRGANGMHVGMHLCRGNRGGHWHAEGAMTLLRTSCSTRSISASSSWNTILPVRVIFHRCGSCRSPNRSF
jgi:5-methyltetrahydropteroyltriglutamate--homocysteine methyltransferase